MKKLELENYSNLNELEYNELKHLNGGIIWILAFVAAGLLLSSCNVQVGNNNSNSQSVKADSSSVQGHVHVVP